MVSLKLQKRLAASVLGAGERKVWLDPNEINEISMANSRTWKSSVVVLGACSRWLAVQQTSAALLLPRLCGSHALRTALTRAVNAIDFHTHWRPLL